MSTILILGLAAAVIVLLAHTILDFRRCWREWFGDAPLTHCAHCGGKGVCSRSCCTEGDYASGQPCPGGICRECGGGR